MSNSEEVKSILNFMTNDHRRCDDLYAAGEEAALAGDAEKAVALTNDFISNMTKHLDMEEKVFFPAFTQATGMTGGPVQVMIMEHDQMRGVLGQMKSATENADLDGITGLGETMLILMQQHNMKEEGILYPMIDSHLADRLGELLEEAAALEAA